jgi:hypothetical protein
MSYACYRLIYGKEDQTLMIDDEPNKAFWIFFLESFKRQNLSKTKVQWLDLTFCLWPLLIELSFVNNVWGHYEVMVKYYKPRLSSSLKNYYRFLQYMDNDNGNVCNNQPPLKTHVPSLPLFIFSLCKSFFIITFVHCYMFSYSLVVLYSLLFVIDLDCCLQTTQCYL